MSKVRYPIGIAVVAIAVLAAGLLLGRSAETTASLSPTPSTTAPAASSAPAGTVVIAAPNPQPEPAPEPVPEPQPAPGVLAVGPSVVDLPKGTWSGQFVVANVGGSDLAWFAVGVPANVSLSATQGVLPAGADTTVTATVDHTTLAKGPFSLTLHVSANDTAQAVTLKGVKEIKVVVPPGPGNLSLLEK